MSDKMREALELIAAPMRADGTWDRDRLACQQLAIAALAEQPAQGEQIGWLNTVTGTFIPLHVLAATERTRAQLASGEIVRVYTAPPAPAVPDALPPANQADTRRHAYAVGWNACRAAMLAATQEVKP